MVGINGFLGRGTLHEVLWFTLNCDLITQHATVLPGKTEQSNQDNTAKGKFSSKLHS